MLTLQSVPHTVIPRRNRRVGYRQLSEPARCLLRVLFPLAVVVYVYVDVSVWYSLLLMEKAYDPVLKPVCWENLAHGCETWFPFVNLSPTSNQPKVVRLS